MLRKNVGSPSVLDLVSFNNCMMNMACAESLKSGFDMKWIPPTSNSPKCH